VKSASVTYAHSLFSLAEDENILEQIFEELNALTGIFEKNPEYAVLLDSPTVNTEERLALIDEAFKDAGEYVRNFLKILCESIDEYLGLGTLSSPPSSFSSEIKSKSASIFSSISIVFFM